MEVSQLIELMNAVSEAGLTDFCYEENGVSVKIKKHPEKKIVASAPVEMIAPSAVAAPAQIPAAAPTAKDSDAAEEILWLEPFILQVLRMQHRMYRWAIP